MKILNIIATIPVLLTLTSCTTDIGTSTYQTSNIGRPQITMHGTVLSVREVDLESTNYVAPSIGAGLGAIAGAFLGGSQHRVTGAAIGGAAGAVGGHVIKPKTKRKGYEYQVQADSGHIYTIVQGPDIVLSVGQRVSIIFPEGGDELRGRLLPL
ncbi:MAG: glycine zipper 2TM domain-containing protein [Holosporales bacterium]|jgi:outer membrane lipoprotein SlyB|nr:glycine zipper 2TM domain-containing protein [Holosporales bacterium]